MDIEGLAKSFSDGNLTGFDLSELVKTNKISKSDRRKVVKLSDRYKKAQTMQMTQRQKLRFEAKEKKKLPRLSKEERKRKFHKGLEDQRERDAANFTICLGCRKRGHFVKNCPKLDMCIPAAVVETDEICFYCGSSEHTLKKCPKPRDSNAPLPFANCFICKRVGHISRDCPENANGLYPNGGCCHICLQKTHLVKDCPERTEEDKLNYLAKKEKAEEEKKNGLCLPGLIDDGRNLSADALIIDEDAVQTEIDSNEDEEPSQKKRKASKGRNKAVESKLKKNKSM